MRAQWLLKGAEHAPFEIRSAPMKRSLPARFFIALAAVVWALALVGAAAQAPDVEARVEAILKKLTLEEKIDLLGGYRGYYTTPNERLGPPAMRMSDGPMGVRNYGPATAFPAGIGLAATWDTELAHRVGRAMGLEARARRAYLARAGGEHLPRADEWPQLRILRRGPLPCR